MPKNKLSFGNSDVVVNEVRNDALSFGNTDIAVDETKSIYGETDSLKEVSRLSKETSDLSVELGIPLYIVEKNYGEIKGIADPDDLPEQEEIRPLEIGPAPENKSLLKSIFGYEGDAKPEYYWNMNPIKKAAFDSYMFGRHILKNRWNL